MKFEDEYEMAGKQIDVKQGIKHGIIDSCVFLVMSW